MTYLDWAATAIPDPNIMDAAAQAATEFFGNPSSPYPLGKAARGALEDARRRSAVMLGCRAEQLVFTSGGTEANAMVFLSRLVRLEPGTILISGLEHPSVAEPAAMLAAHGGKLKVLPPADDGRLSPELLADALAKEEDVRLVAVMGVNNETGSVQPIAELIETVRKASGNGGRRVHFHADMVQAVGKIPVNLDELGVDSASVSAHKFRGPRGVGLLYLRNPRFDALVRGGGQERGIRPGTENVAGALGLAMALEKYGRPSDNVAKNGAYLIEGLRAIEGSRIIPAARKWSPNNYVPGIISVSYPAVPGEVLARVLSGRGFAVSTGSACSSNKKGKLSKAMVAIGAPKDVAAGMIRVSIGPTTTRDEIDAFLNELKVQLPALVAF